MIRLRNHSEIQKVVEIKRKSNVLSSWKQASGGDGSTVPIDTTQLELGL